MASKKGVFGESKVNRGTGLFLIQIKLYFGWEKEGLGFILQWKLYPSPQGVDYPEEINF